MQALQMIEREQYPEAIQFLSIAISMDATQPQYFLKRAQTYLKMGNRSQARVDFQQVLKMDPNSKEAQSGLTLSGTAGTVHIAENPAPPPKKVKPLDAPKTAGKESEKKSSGGLFGFFGKKKT
jgi:tetratricopeptide (TPR) repeat protein